MRRPPLVVVMGVSGAGKSTVAERLAHGLQVDYTDADQLHPAANIAKMAAGEPLTDADRWPWLDSVGGWLAQRAATGAVVACSALRRSYRDAITDRAPAAWFLYLDAGQELLRERLRHRPQHFMPAMLLDSQLETLEPPGTDERAVVVEASSPPEAIVRTFLDTIDRS